MDLKVFYQEAKKIVCEVTGVEEKSLFGCNRESCVDARYILVAVLAKYLTDDEVARVTGLSRSCANKIRNGAVDKMRKFSFCCFYRSAHEGVRNLADAATKLT